MLTVRTDHAPLHSNQDIVGVRQVVRSWCLAIQMGLVDLTKIVTAASEIARNTVEHGQGGTFTIDELRDGVRKGLRLTFVDEGPGIDDIPRAMTDGYTSGSGMGLGLGGTRRLVDEFHIESTPGHGTRIVITKWSSR